MAGEFWVVGEPQATAPRLARVSAEIATIARRLGDASGRGVVGHRRRAPSRRPRRRSWPATCRSSGRSTLAGAGDRTAAASAAPALAALIEAGQPSHVLHRRDAGRARPRRHALGAARLGRARERARGRLGRAERQPSVADEHLRRPAPDHECLHRLPGHRHDPAQRGRRRAALRKPGIVESVAAPAADALPEVAVVDRVSEAGAAAPDRGGARSSSPAAEAWRGADGFDLVQELADALGGAVGATRAAVDAGWIPFAQQIGQTGKIVKPALYLALGISGAIQHKVGMQTAETIVAVNRDPDAPIAEYADLFVVGDLFEVGPAIVAELRARRRFRLRAHGRLSRRNTLETPESGSGLYHILWYDASTPQSVVVLPVRSPMRCPQCGARETRVVDSRDLDDSTTIRRRRECAACASRFTTYERVEAARLVVVKRDGTRQEFDREKLAAGLRKALTRRPVPDRAADRPPTRSRRSSAPPASRRCRAHGSVSSPRSTFRRSTRSPTSASPACTRASRISRTLSAKSTA